MTATTPAAGATRARPTTRSGTGGRRRRPGGRPLWMLLPGALLLLVVVVIPLVFAVWISLTDLDQYTLRQWVSAPFLGVGNFAEAITDSPLLPALGRSVVFAVLTTVVTIPVGVAAAFAVSGRFRGRGLVRSLFLIPYVLPSFVVGTVWRAFFTTDGVVNQVLSRVGIDGGAWLIGGRSFWTLVAVDLWASWPFVYLLTLAGLTAIDPDVHEAAAVDGTTWTQKIRFIVLPALAGPLALAVVISTLNHLNNFSLPFLLFGSPAPDAATVAPIAIYQASFQQFRFSLAAAMSLLSLVVVLIPLLAYLRAVRLDVGRDAEGGGRRAGRAEVEA